MTFVVRRFGIAALILCISLCVGGLSYGQTADPIPANQQEQILPDETASEKTELKALSDDPLNVSDIDMSDPAIKEAMDALEEAKSARDEAEQALGKALLEQRESNSTNDAVKPKTAGLSKEVIQDKAQAILDKVLGWLKSPAFLAQIGAVIIGFFLSPIIAGQFRKRLFFFRDPPAEDAKLLAAKSYIYRSREFLRLIVFAGLMTLFAVILKSVPNLGEDWLVKLVQGIAVVMLLHKAIAEFVPNDLLRKMATWIAIPLALLAVFGQLDTFMSFLSNTPVIPMDPPVTAMTVVRLVFFGGLFFWLGNLSNNKGQDAIRSQEGLDIATREVVGKLFQMLLFVVVVVLVMSFAGIPLSGLVMIVSAIGLGIGLGLQPVAANFVSGIIILFDRSVRKGDFVVLPEGQEGYVEAINMRSTTIETTDGKDIMVPNTTFIENTYENWTHKDPSQRYEVYFKVPYDTDIDTLEDILIPAISAYPKVLMEPEEPDLELREFGEYGIHFAIEFWVSGIDDGENKFTSDLNYLVWRTLRDNGIKMPLPRREVINMKP